MIALARTFGIRSSANIYDWRQCRFLLRGFGGLVAIRVATNRVIHFVSMDGHFTRRLHPKSYFIAAYLNDIHGNIIVDHDRLVFTSRYD
jgi:hypothetical protein